MRLTTLLPLPLLLPLVACTTPPRPHTDNPTECASAPPSSIKLVTKDVTIRTAADWDELPAGCWDLEGTLTLEGDAVTSLAKLDKLVAVDHLEITDTKLTTFDAPLFVYESVAISGNAQLTSLADLVIDGRSSTDVEIDDNAVLADLGELADLAEVKGDLAITRNPKLAKLELRKLETITGSTRIASNATLTTIDLGKLETVARFEVLDNAALTTIGAFPARTISGDVTIRNNPKLTTLGSMSSLDTISGALTIDNNAALTTIGMFTTSMRWIGTMLTVSNNPQLTNLGQLAHLQIIGGITVTSNGKLPVCRAQELGRCVPQHGAVSITGNDNATMTCTYWCD